MRILFVVNNNYLAKNGIAVVSKYLAEGLSQNNNVAVATIDDKKHKLKENYNGITITRFYIYLDWFKKPCGDTESFKKYLISEEYDVLILENLQTAMGKVILTIIDNIKAIKILHTHDFPGLYLKIFQWRGDIFHSIGNTYNYIIWNHFYKKKLPNIINSFDATVSLTKCNRDYDYLEKYYKGRKMILGNAVEDSFFQELDYELDFPLIESKNYFINVSNYNHIKNQKELLYEFYKLTPDKEYALVFCGSEHNKYLDQLIKCKRRLDKKYGEKEVLFLIDYPRQKMPKLIQSATLYLCSSRWEAFSISLLESLTVGTPFISVDVGNAKELPGGVVVNKVSDMHMAINQLLGDESRIREYAVMGKKYTRDNCRVDVAVERISQLLDELS